MHVVVWQECYWRWKALNEILMLAMNEENGDLSSVSQVRPITVFSSMASLISFLRTSDHSGRTMPFFSPP